MLTLSSQHHIRFHAVKPDFLVLCDVHFSTVPSSWVLQATIQGFESKGFSKEQSENLLTKSVEFAREAREMFLKEHLDQSTPTQQPILVAASIGSYGAYLADGSEYRYLAT